MRSPAPTRNDSARRKPRRARRAQPAAPAPSSRLQTSAVGPAASSVASLLDPVAWRVAAGVSVGLSILAVDALVREEPVDRAASLGLYVAAGASLGLVASLAAGLAVLLRPRGGIWAERLRGTTSALFGAAALLGPVFGTFSGRMAKKGVAGALGPYLALGSIALVVYFLARLHRGAALRAEAGEPRRALALAAAFVALAGALVAADLNVLVSLYAQLHAALELLAVLALFGAASLGWRVAAQRPAVRRVAQGVGALGVAWLLAFAASPSLRAAHAARLEATSREPVYVGRMARRVKQIEGLASGRAGDPGLSGSRTRELLARFDVESATRAPAWDKPLSEPPEVRDQLASLREAARGKGIVVYYVDTLRQDVAHDEETMPNMARFLRESVSFENAYSTGSDTLRALPALVGGSYDLERPMGNGLLAVARRARVPTELVIAESAAAFLGQLMPEFSFDSVQRIADHAQGGVWGYGADGATAAPIVDAALSSLERRGKEPFLLWLFNFDVHNWRELDRKYVYGVAERFGVPDEGRWNWRYRAVARGLDAQFGRLLTGIEELGLADDVIVLVVSDHGEALGYRDFWVHSTFLWEPLIRVPLAIRAPGLPRRAVEAPVSIVDVAPTLARYLEPHPPTKGWHGEDLLGHLLPQPPKRRLPLLTASVSERKMNRIGIVDGDRKLVLPLEWGAPELYDLEAPDPDEAEVSAKEPRRTLELMEQLLRSPFFELASAAPEGSP